MKLLPIDTAERDLERRNGAAALMKAVRASVPLVVDLSRSNLAAGVTG